MILCQFIGRDIWNYAEKEVPQPQVSLAFGLLKLKPLF